MKLDLQRLARDGWLRRVDAALGEWVLRAFPQSTDEVGLAAALAARAIGEGHSALQLDVAQIWVANQGGRGAPPALPDAQSWQAILHGCDAVKRVDATIDLSSQQRTPLTLDARGRLYLTRYFNDEQRLARQLMAQAREDRLKLITGGPGTGKTHGVVRLLAGLVETAQAQSRELRIALTAPTGKAAARLAMSVRAQLPSLDLTQAVAEVIPREAATLHRLLGVSPARAQPAFHSNAPLPYDVVVVDEVSMIDLPMMRKLVDAVRDDARLILLGDPDQLAAVEAGDVLGALVDAAREAPLRDCHVHLTKSYRFDAQSPLGRLAVAIVGGDAQMALAALATGDGARLCSYEPHKELARLLDEATAAYTAVTDADDPEDALRAAQSYRVLTALRQGTLGNLAINQAIEQRLLRRAGLRADTRWWRGRLVMITANRTELGLFNGDVGVVWPDAHGAPKVWFEGADGALRALSPAALPPHEGAFALTVHKAQGSEFSRVALLLGADSTVLTRELLYTGVTRARESLQIYADETLLRTAIARRTQRWNGLADRLREAAQALNF